MTCGDCRGWIEQFDGWTCRGCDLVFCGLDCLTLHECDDDDDDQVDEGGAP